MSYFVDGRAPRSTFAMARKDDTPRFGKPKSAETKHRERVELAYEHRSNRCDSCHTTRSMTGECMC